MWTYRADIFGMESCFITLDLVRILSYTLYETPISRCCNEEDTEYKLVSWKEVLLNETCVVVDDCNDHRNRMCYHNAVMEWSVIFLGL